MCMCTVNPEIGTSTLCLCTERGEGRVYFCVDNLAEGMEQPPPPSVWGDQSSQDEGHV